MIHVRNITIELTQQLDTGEEQSLIIEHDGETATMSTENWTQGVTTMSHIAEATTEALATARIHLRVIQLENKP
jgi:hypothetical protein